MGIVVLNLVHIGKGGLRPVLGAAVGVLFLFPSATLRSADNKIQFGTKPPTSPSLPATAPRGNSASFPVDGGQSKNPLSPTVDPNVLSPNNPPPSNERQKWLELYRDRQQNWMFVDPKEGSGKVSAKEVFGVTGFDAGNQEDKKTIEKYWERERNDSKKSNTNDVSDAKSDKQDDRSSDKGGAWNQSDDAPADSFGGGVLGQGGLRSPIATPSSFGGMGRLPTFSDGLGGGSGITRNGFGLAAPSPEFQNKIFDVAPRPSPLSGPLDPINMKVDSTVRELNPVVGRTIPSAATGPVGPSAPDSARGLAMPGLPNGTSGLDGFGSRYANPSASIFTPSLAPAASTSYSPQRPAVLEFPKRVF